MKIKRIFTSIPFLVGLFLIIYAGFGFVYIQKQSEWRNINSQIIPARTVLEKPAAADLGALESQLDAAETDFEQAWAVLPRSDQGIELYDTLVELARLNSIELNSIAASLPSEENYQGITYTTLQYNLNVGGSKTNILRFISSLVDGPQLLQSCRVKNLAMNTSESANSTGYENSTASLQIYVYGRPK